MQALLKSSGGLNLGMAYLSGALGHDPLAYTVRPDEAARVLWFDALVGNVDRSWRNPNLLVWHGDLWLVDHGATMIWHHSWPTAQKSALRPYDGGGHVLAPFTSAPEVAATDAELRPRITPELLDEVTADIPEVWLDGEPGFATPDEVRRAYAETLLTRAEGLLGRLTLPSGLAPAGPPYGWRLPATGEEPRP